MRLQKDLDESIERLLKEGKERGYIDYDEISQIFSDDVVWSPYLEDLFSRIDEEGIEVKEPTPLRERWVGYDREDPISLYLEEVKRIPRLTKEEEQQLGRCIEEAKLELKQIENRLGISVRRIRRYQNQLSQGQAAQLPISKDEFKAIVEKIDECESKIQRSRQRLIEANLYLVVNIASHYSRNNRTLFMDLIDEGNIGLIRAVDKFDYKEGYRFSTYGVWWIRQAILKGLKNLGRVIRVPAYVIDKLTQCMRTIERLEQQFGREVTLGEVAQAMGISLDKLVELVTLSQEPTSLEKPIGEGVQLGDVIEDKKVLSPEQVTFFKLLEGEIDNLLAQLNVREREILRLRFGFGGVRVHTLEELGKLFGVTRERIRQLQTRALKKLQNCKISKELYEVLYR